MSAMTDIDAYIKLYSAIPIDNPTTIRAIRLLAPAEEGGDQLKCEIRAIRLDQRPEYTALSYTWGHPILDSHTSSLEADVPPRIVCNGVALNVTENLHECLAHMSCDDFFLGTELWIDALCINQRNDDERSEQVNLMSEIYSSAQRVVVWLGVEDEYTQRAYALMDALARITINQRRRIDPYSLNSTETVALLGDCAAAPYWDALSHFFRRKWFTRAWVIQEVILARSASVHCGSFSIPWSSVASVSDVLATTSWTNRLRLQDEQAGRSYYSLPAKIDAVRRTYNDDPDQVLLYSLIRARSFRTTDPRDKVYALLGIEKRSLARRILPPEISPAIDTSTPLRPHALFPDYFRSARTVYTEAATYILSVSSDLLILAHAEGSDFRSIPGLPSWVPDWSVGETLGLGITGYRRYRASGSLPRALSFLPASVLRLQAARIAPVVATAETIAEIDRDAALLPHWLALASALPRVCPRTGHHRVETLWRCLAVDTSGPPVRCPADGKLADAFAAWLLLRSAGAFLRHGHGEKVGNTLDGLDALAEMGGEGGLLPSAAEVRAFTRLLDEAPDGEQVLKVRLQAEPFALVCSHTPTLRLVRLGIGLAGCGAQSVRAGDDVWIAPGSRVPLILRRRGDGQGESRNERYELVGGTYIHGIMHGELVEEGGLDIKMIEIE